VTESLSAAQLQARRPVWEALSSLFLDTDTSLLRDWRAQQLAASPYALPDLERILVDEVYPVCRWNLLQVAGEWAGFDPDWLERRILSRRRSPFRFLHHVDPFPSTVLGSREWRATKAAIASMRADPGSPPVESSTSPPNER
jgi:hypothetical protein